MAKPVATFTVRDPSEIRDSGLRTVRNGLISIGVADPNVTPGSDTYNTYQGFSNELAVTEANCVVKADELMPDTCTGDALLRWCRPYGISKRDAAGSTGTIVLESSAATTVSIGTQLIDGTGLRYEISVGGIYADGDSIACEAIDTGTATNLAEGDVLRWVSPPAFAASTALVGVDGFVNGAPEDTDETLRARLFAHWQNPPASGNAQHVAEICEASTSSVQKAFTYPAAQGAGTVHACCVAAPTETNKSRAIAAATMNTVVIPYVQGQLPEHVYSVITTAVDQDMSIAFDMSIPSSPNASPPGSGGGWVDGTPWPIPIVNTVCDVSAVTSSKVFTIQSVYGFGPSVGVSRISWLSPFDWKIRSATVVSSTSPGLNQYEITLDVPFTNIAVGCYIWPQCVNQQEYVDAVLAAFAEMGPGEKTTNGFAQIRSFRHPPPTVAHNYGVGPWMLGKLSDAGNEIYSSQYRYRDDGGTPNTDEGGTVTPAIPGGIEGEPRIFVPNHIAFYPVQ